MRVGVALSRQACASTTPPSPPLAVSAVVRRFADNHMNPKPSVAALGPLQSAMESLSGGEPALLTPAHAAYLRAALATGHVQKAHTVAKVPVFQVQSRQDGMHYTDALLYFYYAGSALCAYQDWRAAVQAFTCALAFPATALSSIVVAAYKKFVCASLLHSGSVSPLPRHTSSTVSKTVSKHAQAYTMLAKAFQSLNDVAVGTVIAENTAAFQGDSNLGLVMQVLASLKQRRVLKLTNTFLTLSLADIAEKAELESPAAAEAELLSMIQDGKLRATIDQRVGMVTFGGEGQAYATPAEVSRLTQRIATATDVARHFSSLSKTVEVSDEYLERKITSQSADAGQGGVGGGAGADADVQGMTG